MLSLKPSRRKSVKILTIGSYAVMSVDVVQNLFFVPLYLTHIGAHLYGLWLGTGGILTVLAFLDMGMASLTIQRVSREFGVKNFDGVSKYFFAGTFISIAFVCILLMSGLLLSKSLEHFFPQTTIKETLLLTTAFRIALVDLSLSLLTNTIEGTLNALQQSLVAKIIQFVAALIGLAVIYFLLFGDSPLLAIPIGMFIRTLINFVGNSLYLVILFIKNKIRLINYNKEIITEFFKYMPSLMLSKLGTSLLNNIEPTLINMFISPEVAVFYAVTKKAGLLIRTILDRIGAILYPSMAHLYAEDNKNKFSDFFVKFLNSIVPVTLILFLMLLLLNESFVSIWVGGKNYLGTVANAWICFSLFATFLSNILSYLLSITGEIKFSNNMVFWESLTKLIAIFILLYLQGINGLSSATGFVGLIFTYVYLKKWSEHLFINDIRKKELIRGNIKQAVLLTGLTALFYVVIRYCYPIHSYAFFIIYSLVILTAMIAAVILSNRTFESIIKSILIKKQKG